MRDILGQSTIMRRYTHVSLWVGFATVMVASCTTLTSQEKETSARACLDQGQLSRGGSATQGADRRQTRGHQRGRRGRPSFGLSEGCRQFFLVWRPARPGRRDRRNDGVGPLFNAQSCIACHQKGDSNDFLVVQISIDGRGPDGGPKPHPAYGLQIQDRALRNIEPEAQINARWWRFNGAYEDGRSYSLEAPEIHLSELAYGGLGDDTQISPRRIPTVYDTGLMEQVPQLEMEKQADPDDQDGDGISGRINWVPDVETGEVAVGRLGWKANQPTLRQQIAGALHFDMGLTSPLIGRQNCSDLQQQCKRSVVGGYPEVNRLQFDAVVEFSRYLRTPERPRHRTASVVKGQKIFTQLGCAKCHLPTYSSADGKEIALYSDLLVHDMGESLADNRPQFTASGSEWRTAPLIGFARQRQNQREVRLLHDGRAASVEEAILWHGGEGASAKEAFRKARKSDRNALVEFVNAL